MEVSHRITLKIIRVSIKAKGVSSKLENKYLERLMKLSMNLIRVKDLSS